MTIENLIQIKSEKSKNVDKSAKIWENQVCEKDYIWNPHKCIYKKAKYLQSVIGDSVITCDEIIEITKTVPANFKISNKLKN